MFAGKEFTDIRKALDEIPIIDTHEHYSAEWNAPETTLYQVCEGSYVGGWLAHDNQLEANPSSLAAWLSSARYNSYTVSLLRGLSELYGVDVRGRESAALERLAEKVREAYRDPGWALAALRRGGIQHTIVDPIPFPGYTHAEPTFHLSLRSHMLVHGYDRGARDHNENSPWEYAAKLGRGLSSFDDYLDFVDFWVSEHKRKGAVAIKSALAYERDLEIGPVSHREAARIFGSETSDAAERKSFGDFILNLLAQKAAEYDLVYQIHTGMALQSGSHPRRLTWLLDSNPDTVFDLFHAGYPWLDDVLAMASERPNLIVDTCWLPLISPSAAVRFYHEYAEVAFGADTLLWGGDNYHAEETYGAALTFKDCLAKAIADKVEGGYWTRREGLRYAEGVMWRAASHWFRMAL